MTNPFVYGRNPVREVVRAGRREVRQVWALEGLVREPWLVGLHVHPRDRQALSRVAGSAEHQGIVAFTGPYPYCDADEIVDAPGPIVVLDGVQDVHNVGAVARVAEVAGAAGLVMAERGSPGITPAVCKASAGAVEHLRVARVESLVAFVHDARRAARRAIGGDGVHGADYREATLDDRTILVMGAEGEGLRPRLAAVCDELVRIPMAGRVESLNLSVATGVLLFRAVHGV